MMNRNNDILIFPHFLHIDAPWWPNTEINITEMKYPIDFIICYTIAIHCVCKLWTGTMILWFFPIFYMSLPPGGQIQKSKWLKCCTLIDFIICHKFAIHCACKLWTGMMIFIFFPTFRHIDAPWWPNTEINITEMKYPDTFHELLQYFNSLCM